MNSAEQVDAYRALALQLACEPNAPTEDVVKRARQYYRFLALGARRFEGVQWADPETGSIITFEGYTDAAEASRALIGIAQILMSSPKQEA